MYQLLIVAVESIKVKTPFPTADWEFTPTSPGYYLIYLKVTDNVGVSAKSNTASVTVFGVAPPISVSISPLSASILVGDSVTLASTVSGGTWPYTYLWYLNDNPVFGATSSSCAFTPTSTRIYYVYLVTDANSDTVQSDTATITVTSVPVRDYSISLTKPFAKTPLIFYTMLLAMFGAAISLIKRKIRNSGLTNDWGNFYM